MGELSIVLSERIWTHCSLAEFILARLLHFVVIMERYRVQEMNVKQVMVMSNVMGLNHIVFSNIFLGFFLSLIADSCTHRTARDSYEELSPLKTITAFSDSIYLSGDVSCLESIGNHIVVSDYSKGVFVIDGDGGVVETFTASGNGPGEVLGYGHLAVSTEGDIWLYDEGHRVFRSYRGGRLHSTVPSPAGSLIATGSRFFVKADSLFFPTLGQDRFVTLMKGGEVVGQMCPESTYDDLEMPLHSERHVMKGEHSFFVVCLGLPLVEEYTFEGELLSSFDLMSIPERAWVFNENQSFKPNTYFVATRDAYYKNGFLYLLSASTKDGYHCNQVYVLKEAETGLQYTGRYLLTNGESYSSICVSDQKYMMAFNREAAAIEVFMINF